MYSLYLKMVKWQEVGTLFKKREKERKRWLRLSRSKMLRRRVRSTAFIRKQLPANYNIWICLCIRTELAWAHQSHKAIGLVSSNGGIKNHFVHEHKLVSRLGLEPTLCWSETSELESSALNLLATPHRHRRPILDASQRHSQNNCPCPFVQRRQECVEADKVVSNEVLWCTELPIDRVLMKRGKKGYKSR